MATALCVLLFCLLRTILSRLDAAIEGRSPKRLVTTNVVQMSALPPFNAERIAGVPGVIRVTRMVVFGGFLRTGRSGKVEPGFDIDWTTFFQSLAVDAEPYLAMRPELALQVDQRREFMADVRGCVMGRELAEKFGWRIGSHFFLESFASGLRKRDGPFEFVIRGFLVADLAKHPGAETDVMLFHFRYLEATLGAGARASLYMSEIAEPRKAPEVATAIDALFENSSDATLTQTEGEFLSDLIAMVGHVSSLLNGIGLAVCFAILLVTANTMGIAVRERRTEVAVLKTIGFTSAQVLGLVLAEALLLGLAGGALGLVGTEGVLWLLAHRLGMVLPGMAALKLRPQVASLGVGVALLLGLAAGFMPAWTAYRARVAEMLRAL